MNSIIINKLNEQGFYKCIKPNSKPPKASFRQNKHDKVIIISQTRPND